MMITMDNSGRIVLPKPLRQKLGFGGDTALEIIEQPDGLLLRPVENRPVMTKQDGLWVHGGIARTDLQWDRLTDDAHDERLQFLLNR